MRWRTGFGFCVVFAGIVVANPMERVLPLVRAAVSGVQGSLQPAVETPAEKPQPPSVFIDAVTFASEKQKAYVPLKELAKTLGWKSHWDRRKRVASLDGKAIPTAYTRWLLDGTLLVSLSALKDRGYRVTWRQSEKVAAAEGPELIIVARQAPKRVVVNRSSQYMRAWQGGRLIMAVPISTGRRGFETPRGRFTAGPLKAPMLISRKYNDARMPWSIQVWGHVCIHGHTSVPRRAASHGCIRVPLSGQNPARWLYNWIDLGTPITIADAWTGPAVVKASAKKTPATAAAAPKPVKRLDPAPVKPPAPPVDPASPAVVDPSDVPPGTGGGTTAPAPGTPDPKDE